MKIAILGECMVELRLVADDTARIAYSGDTLNTAVYLARAAGPEIAAIHYVTALGRDGFSDRMLRFFESEGLRADLIERRVARSPGLYAIETDAAGERRFTYWRSDSAARTLFEPEETVTFDALSDFDLLYLSGISLAILRDGARERLIDWLKEFRRGGGRVAFDSNYRPALWSSPAVAADAMERVWRQADIGFPSIDDEMTLFGDPDEVAVIARLNAWGVRAGALKRGARGPKALVSGAAEEDFPAAETVVDTTAAGDSFNAGWLAAWARGEDDATRRRAGHDLARRVVGVAGAIMPR